MSRTTLASTNARIDALERAFAELPGAIVAALRETPAAAPQAPAKSAAASPFVVAMRERAAAKLPCAIHPASKCNRRFSPKSSGGENHLARIV